MDICVSLERIKEIVIGGDTLSKDEEMLQLVFETENKWNKRITLKKWNICKNCKITGYCTRKCQKVHWNKYNHKKHCNKVSKCVYKSVEHIFEPKFEIKMMNI